MAVCIAVRSGIAYSAAVRLLSSFSVVPLLACALACSKSGGSTAPSTTGAAGSATTVSAATASHAGLPAASDLHCDKLVPSSLRAKYMQGMELTEIAAGGAGHICDFQAPAANAGHDQVHVSYLCDHASSDDDVQAWLNALRMTQGKSIKDMPAIGRTAVEGDFLGKRQIHFWDSKTPCFVIVDFGGHPPASTQEVARALFDALTPASIGK
jgi:hypothetical protein